MTTPRKFRKKPVEIEAMQWDGTAVGASPVIDWVLSNGGTATYACTSDPCSGGEDGHTIAVDTLEGRNLDARSGWWVIRGIEGEFYPCKPSVFAATYEALGPTESAPPEGYRLLQRASEREPRLVKVGPPHGGAR